VLLLLSRQGEGPGVDQAGHFKGLSSAPALRGQQAVAWNAADTSSRAPTRVSTRRGGDVRRCAILIEAGKAVVRLCSRVGCRDRKLGMSRVPRPPIRRHTLFCVTLGALLCLFQQSTHVYPISMQRRGSLQAMVRNGLARATQTWVRVYSCRGRGE
jgi:hypothetical protein